MKKYETAQLVPDAPPFSKPTSGRDLTMNEYGDKLSRPKNAKSRLRKGEKLEVAFSGRVEEVRKKTVLVTLLNSKGEAYTGEFKRSLFRAEPEEGDHFLVINVSKVVRGKKKYSNRIYKMP